jgi:hypothetical protein
MHSAAGEKRNKDHMVGYRTCTNGSRADTAVISVDAFAYNPQPEHVINEK